MICLFVFFLITVSCVENGLREFISGSRDVHGVTLVTAELVEIA
jgi:hypothetical protein